MSSYDIDHDYFEAYKKAVDYPLPKLKKTFIEEFDFLRSILKEDYYVLDVGCGIIRPLKDLAPSVKKAVGIDNDNRMVAEARRRGMGINNLNLIKCDALNLCFQDKVFNTAYSIYNTIGSVERQYRQRFINEMKRAVKPGGTIVNITWNRNDETTKFLQEYYPYIGLKILDINKERTVTSRMTFDRMSREEIKNYYDNANIQNTRFIDLDPVWMAAIGTVEA